MAEDQQDESQKTEEPTHKRLQDAREKGQIARSQEVNHWFMILGFTLIVGVFAPSLVFGIGEVIIPFVERPHGLLLEAGGLEALFAQTLKDIGLVLLLPVLILVFLALLAGVIQSGFNISTENMVPKLEKVSPLRGLKRLFSMRSVAEFAKGVAKILIVAAVITVIMWPERGIIPQLAGLPMSELMSLMHVNALKVLIAVLAVMTVVASLDFVFQTFQHRKQLRMSRQEIKDEHKQTEGDPMVKARLRQLRMERARQRMMAAVPEADVVIANPTHFAVALKYELGDRGAPKVTAKGVDFLALRIREMAEQHDVPVVENPPLARALYDGVDLDQEIPEQHFKAVAEIIGYVFRLKGKVRPGH